MHRQALQEHILRIRDRDFGILCSPVLFHRISHVVVCMESVKVISQRAMKSAARLLRCVRLAHLHVEQPVFDRGPLFRSP